MGHAFNPASSLNASTSRDGTTNTVRIDVLGSLNQASRPALVHMIHELRSEGIGSPVCVDLSRAALVESTALAGLRDDLNAMDGTFETPGGGVSLVLTEEAAFTRPEDHQNAGLPGTTHPLDIAAAATFETGSLPILEPTAAVLPAGPLEEYSDAELFAASDAVFALLDDPGTVGGPDLLGTFNDISQEILRRTPASELLNPSAVNPPAESQPAG